MIIAFIETQHFLFITYRHALALGFVGKHFVEVGTFDLVGGSRSPGILSLEIECRIT